MTETGYLTKNLEAVAAVDPVLHERLCWPVSSEHVRFDADRAYYRWQQSELGLDLPEAAVEGLIRMAPADQPCFVFGIGLGEVLAGLLPGRSQPVTAWERDPWLLRLALGRYDFAESIREGTLGLALSADLLRLAPLPADVVLIEHPVLRQPYRHERQLLIADSAGDLALLGEGGLLVDDVARALRAEGYRVFPVDLHLLAVEELSWTVHRFRPALLVAVNYTEGLGEFCSQHGVPLVCWEIDPAADEPSQMERNPAQIHIFTYRQANVGAFQRAGFTHVSYLPLAADPELRHPTPLSEDQRERYARGVSFVGSSLTPERASYEHDYYLIYEEWRPAARARATALLEAALAEQAGDWSAYAIPSILTRLAPEISDDIRRKLARCVGEIAAAQRRWAYVAGLLPLGINVWGDEGWRPVAGSAYRGPAGHFFELNHVYCGSMVNLDINRLYQTDIVPLRVFDVLATGSFVLAEHSAALEDCFDVGREIDSYRDADEMEAKVRYYLAHPDEAAAIAERGRAAVLARHTVRQRVRHMLDRV